MQRESAHRSYLFIYFSPGLNASHCEPPRRNAAVLKPRSRRSRLGIKQKLKIPTGNTFRHWRLSRLFTRDLMAVEKNEAEFCAQPRVQRLAFKRWLFLFRDFENYLFIFSKLEASHHIEGASHCTLKGKKKPMHSRKPMEEKYLAWTFFFSTLKQNFGFATDRKEANVLARSANLNI